MCIADCVFESKFSGATSTFVESRLFESDTSSKCYVCSEEDSWCSEMATSIVYGSLNVCRLEIVGIESN